MILVKNAFANLCRGGATAVATLIIPAFLTRILSKDNYGTWLLILQLSTYVSFLDFGIQSSVGRYVAHYNELGDRKARDSIVSSAFLLLIALGTAAMVGIALLTWQLPNLFKDMPTDLHQDAQISFFIVATSLAIALPFNVFGAIFIGLQRYDIPAWIVGSNKLFGSAFVVLVASSSHSIVVMSIVMGISNLIAGFWQYFAYLKVQQNARVSINKASVSSIVEIVKYCSGLLVWSMGMLLVSGLDTAIIGYFDYKSVVYYTLAASISTIITGIQNSIFNTLLPNASALGAREEKENLGKLLISSTRYAMISLIVTSLPVVLGARWLILFWVGEDYVSHTEKLLQLIVAANFLRQIGSPYAIIAMSVGEQKKIILSPIIEGVVNVIISTFLIMNIGVIGVAIGTISGGFISVVSHFCYNLPRTKKIFVKDVSTLTHAVFFPLISLIPTLMYLVVSLLSENTFFDGIHPFSFFILLFLTFLLIYLFIITDSEKKRFFLLVHRLLPSSP